MKLRILDQNFDRYRTVAIANVIKKAHQGINWQVSTLFNSEFDGWTSFQHETSKFVVNIFVATIYSD